MTQFGEPHRPDFHLPIGLTEIAHESPASGRRPFVLQIETYPESPAATMPVAQAVSLYSSFRSVPITP